MSNLWELLKEKGNQRPIHPIIRLIGQAIVVHIQFASEPKDDDMLIDFIEKQVKLYKEGR